MTADDPAKPEEPQSNAPHSQEPNPAEAASAPDSAPSGDSSDESQEPETSKTSDRTEPVGDPHSSHVSKGESSGERERPASPGGPKRGPLGTLIFGFLAFPKRCYEKLLKRKDWGFAGLIVFPFAIAAWLYIVVTPAVMYVCHDFPELSPRDSYPAEPDQVAGVAYCDALIYCYEEGMADNWMVNDRVAPTIFLDNPQNFQLGMLEGVRYSLRLLRESLSRQRSTDAIDPDADTAFNSLSYDATSWLIPRTEAEYRVGIKALRRYRQRLLDGEAGFYPRADNLARFLLEMNSVTGGANNRLLNCIPDQRMRLSEETAGDPTTSGEQRVKVTVPWSQVDDTFYYARGVAFVYRETLSAVNYDFRDVLNQRNADEFSSAIVDDFLSGAQFNPIYVANGRFESLWANHPYKLLGLLSQVRERTRSLRSMVTLNDD